jgi:hypothetical protein
MSTFLYLELIIIGIIVFSAFRMASFLKKAGMKEPLIYTANPMMYLKYMEITKRESGSYGIWFKTFVGALLLGIFLVVLEILM